MVQVTILVIDIGASSKFLFPAVLLLPGLSSLQIILSVQLSLKGNDLKTFLLFFPPKKTPAFLSV